MTGELPRVFFDTNEGNHEHGYWLSLPLSLADLAAINGQLREGLKVLLYMPNEVEMMAVLNFEAEKQMWTAKPIEGLIRYLDGSRG